MQSAPAQSQYMAPPASSSSSPYVGYGSMGSQSRAPAPQPSGDLWGSVSSMFNSVVDTSRSLAEKSQPMLTDASSKGWAAMQSLYSKAQEVSTNVIGGTSSMPVLPRDADRPKSTYQGISSDAYYQSQQQ